jgi:hypothetical protein
MMNRKKKMKDKSTSKATMPKEFCIFAVFEVLPLS